MLADTQIIDDSAQQLRELIDRAACTFRIKIYIRLYLWKAKNAEQKEEQTCMCDVEERDGESSSRCLKYAGRNYF